MGKVIAINRRANFDYEISEKYEAGIVLRGHEVKSIKTGHISLKGAFIQVKKTAGKIPELILTKSHIPLYKKSGNIESYEPERSRKLLLSKKQINYLIGKRQEQGLTLVPTKVYIKNNLIKLEFGVGRGKKKYDKREDKKRKDVERATRIIMRKKIN